MGSPRTYRVGRDQINDIVIEHVSVSRQHCELQALDDGAILLIDLNSKNGTSVRENGAWSPIDRAIVERDERILLGEIVTTVAGLLQRAPQSASDARRAATPVHARREPTAPAGEEAKSFVRRLLNSDWARLNRRRDGTRPAYADAGVDHSSIYLPMAMRPAPAVAVAEAPALPVLVAPPAPAAAVEPRPVLFIDLRAAQTEDGDARASERYSFDVLPPSRPRPPARRPRDRGKWAVMGCALALCGAGTVAAFVHYEALTGRRPGTPINATVVAAVAPPVAKSEKAAPPPAAEKPDVPHNKNVSESPPPPSNNAGKAPNTDTYAAAPKDKDTEPPAAPPPPLRAKPWLRSIPASGNSAVLAAAATRDGGLCLAGSTATKTGGHDALILRVDAQGRTLWQKAPAGMHHDAALAVVQASDGGCVAAGHMGDETQLWLARFDAQGREIWNKTIPAGYTGRATSIVALRDGDYAIAAYARPSALDVDRAFVLRIAANGAIKWSKYVAAGETQALDLRETKDGELVVAGTGQRGERAYLWATRLNGRGDIGWHKQFGGVGRPSKVQLRMARGDEPVLAAAVLGPQPAGTNAAPLVTLRLLRLNQRGGVVWDRRLADAPRRMAGIVLLAGMIVVAGDAGENAEKPELWLARLDASGRLLREDRVAAGRGDLAAALAELKGGRLALAGTADLDSPGKRGAGLLFYEPSSAVLR